MEVKARCSDANVDRVSTSVGEKQCRDSENGVAAGTRFKNTSLRKMAIFRCSAPNFTNVSIRRREQRAQVVVEVLTVVEVEAVGS